MVEKIEVFICYAHKDESLMSELKNQLASLEPQELITIWHDRMIAGGTDWKKEIDSHLNSANIILLLVSSNFTASQYSQVEVKRAMERYTAGEVQVIPVILRPVMWKSSAFGKLSPLPKDGKPVTSSNWSNHDEAWIDVAEGVQKAIDELRKPVVPIEKPGSSDPPQDSSHKEQQPMTQNTKDEKFDVFLCYNSKDEVEVRGIAIQLRDKGIKPWFDKWELRPGTSWQDALQKQIGQINTVAVFVGKGGVGPWQNQELNAYIRKFVNKGSQVIPVLLGDASQMPARPVFLEGLEYVDFRKPETEPMKHLIWGITGENPNVETSTTVQNGLPTPKPSSGLTSQKRHVLEEELKDLMKVDFAIITMLPEEFDAILARFPHTPYTHPTSQQPYGISQVQTKGGKNRLVAMARTTRQGSDASQQLANRMITDLNPQTLLVVGIGGGVPDTDFTLGDVIVSSDIRNFNVNAIKENEPPTFAATGGVHPAISTITTNLQIYQSQLADWNNEVSINVPRPRLLLTEERLKVLIDKDVNAKWRKKVEKALLWYFDEKQRGARPPKFLAAPIASSNTLVRSDALLARWLQYGRDIRAVEMEAAGVYQAAQHIRQQYPVMAIRGISDIIGFERDDDWKLYACHTAAAFAYAFIIAGIGGLPENIISPSDRTSANVPVVPLATQRSSDTTQSRSQKEQQENPHAEASTTGQSSLPGYPQKIQPELPPLSSRHNDLLERRKRLFDDLAYYEKALDDTANARERRELQKEIDRLKTEIKGVEAEIRTFD